LHPEKTPDGNAGSWIPNPQQPADSGTDGSRNGTRSNWPEWCVLSAYATLVACAIPYHEPWADEAQSWELARTLPLGILFKTYVRYEASPGLWHFLLWILSQAHVSYAGLHWICGAIAVASSYLLVFKSPLPRYLRLTLPFTYFLVFQYAVVARSYVLVPPILFMIAMGWKKRPLLVAVMLGLLANTSLHAAVISGGLAIVFGVVQITNGSREDPQRVRRLLLSATIVLGFYAFAIWTAWPPPDFLHTISNFRSESPSFAVAVIQSMVWGICEPWPLAIPFWIAIALWFYARRSLIYLLPGRYTSIGGMLGFWCPWLHACYGSRGLCLESPRQDTNRLGAVHCFSSLGCSFSGLAMRSSSITTVRILPISLPPDFSNPMSKAAARLRLHSWESLRRITTSGLWGFSLISTTIFT